MDVFSEERVGPVLQTDVSVLEDELKSGLDLCSGDRPHELKSG